jgi:hypothetical protein
MTVRPIRYALLSAAVLISTAGFMRARNSPPPGCTVHSLNGSYGYYRAGFSLGTPPSTFTPLGAVGYVVFDGHGGLTSHEVTNKDGTLHSAGWSFDTPPTPAHSGTYEVHPDCTFRFTDATTNPPTTISDGVIAGDELFMVSTGSVATGSSVVTVVGKRMQ